MKFFILTLLLSILTNFGAYAQETYKVGTTEYYHGQYYSTTGKPLVKRSPANKKAFLKSKGYEKTPYGYEIDHIKPLCEGGTDDPSNMQLLTIEQHRRKTAQERANRANNSNNFYYNSSSSNSNYSRTDSKGRTIYTGSRGGRYYINSNGNKTYIK